MQRYFAVTIHDACPSTHADCERLLSLVQRVLPDAPITWLVVPDYHGRARVDRAFEWRRWMDARAVRGDELVLHGYWHLDDGPPSRSLPALIARRVLSDGEAEFAALDERATLARVHRGLAVFECCGWRPAGFTPPAWQMNRKTLPALRRTPLEYVATRSQLLSMHDNARIDAPALSLSARSALRRRASAPWARSWLRMNGSRRGIRLALHPGEAAYPKLMHLWEELLLACAEQRVAVTKRGLLHVMRDGATAPSTRS